MGYEYDIDPARKLIVVRMWGAALRAEITAVRAAVAADPRFMPEFSELIDLRELTSTDGISVTDIQQIASANIDPVRRRAFVAADLAVYGLLRMFDSMRALMPQPEQIRLFRTVPEAEAWLGLLPGDGPRSPSR